MKKFQSTLKTKLCKLNNFRTDWTILFNITIFRTQIHGSLKKKTFEAAGVPLSARTSSLSNSQANALQSVGTSPNQQTVVVVQQPQMITSKSTAEVTLNMLNASETEVDVEGLNFEGANEVVTS